MQEEGGVGQAAGGVLLALTAWGRSARVQGGGGVQARRTELTAVPTTPAMNRLIDVMPLQPYHVHAAMGRKCRSDTHVSSVKTR